MNPPDEMPETVVFVLSTLYLPSAVTLWTCNWRPSGTVGPGVLPEPPPPQPPTTAASARTATAENRRKGYTIGLPLLGEACGRNVSHYGTRRRAALHPNEGNFRNQTLLPELNPVQQRLPPHEQAVRTGCGP